jgi:hypothetical protein
MRRSIHSNPRASTLVPPTRFVDSASRCMDSSNPHGNGTRSCTQFSLNSASNTSNLITPCISIPMERFTSLSPFTLMISPLHPNLPLQLTSTFNSFLITSNVAILVLLVSYSVSQLKGTARLAHSSSINANSFLMFLKSMV